MVYLAHHGIKGMRWGVRRYQNEDGTLTALGRKHYDYGSAKLSRLQKKSARFDRDIESLKPYENTGISTKKGKMVLTSDDVKSQIEALEKTKYENVGKKIERVQSRREKVIARGEKLSNEGDTFKGEYKKAFKIASAALVANIVYNLAGLGVNALEDSGRISEGKANTIRIITGIGGLGLVAAGAKASAKIGDKMRALGTYENTKAADFVARRKKEPSPGTNSSVNDHLTYQRKRKQNW